MWVDPPESVAGEVRPGISGSGATYFADRYTMNPADAKCRTWSPYSVAGWLPAAPDTIKAARRDATGELAGSVSEL